MSSTLAKKENGEVVIDAGEGRTVFHASRGGSSVAFGTSDAVAGGIVGVAALAVLKPVITLAVRKLFESRGHGEASSAAGVEEGPFGGIDWSDEPLSLESESDPFEGIDWGDEPLSLERESDPFEGIDWDE